MLKHIVHLIFFAAGAGVGIWWGADHPSQAAQIAAQEQAKVQQVMAVAQAKKDVLQQVVNDQQSTVATPNAPASITSKLDKYKQMLNSANQEFNSAKSAGSGTTGN